MIAKTKFSVPFFTILFCISLLIYVSGGMFGCHESPEEPPGSALPDGEVDDTGDDPDGDGLDSGTEAFCGTNPGKPDTDGDGLLDPSECFSLPTDPNNPDCDNDGLLDGEEVNTYSTDPIDYDSDDDSWNDGDEVSGQTDPLDPALFPARIIYGSAYSSGGPATLYQIDPLTGQATTVGPIGFDRVSGMDFHPSTGVLYATGERASDGTLVLLTIDTTSGAGTEVGPTGGHSYGDTITDISFRNSDDALYAYLGGGDGLGTLNVATGVLTELGPTGVSCCGNGMAFSPGDTLYHANENDVHTLNQATGAATWVADFVSSPPADDSPRMNGMDYKRDSEILYAALNDGTGGDHENYLSILDTSTGAVSIIGQTVDGLDAIAVGGRLICNGDCVAVEVNGVVRIMDSVTRRDTNVYQTARDNCIAAGGDMANFDESYVWATTVWMTNSSDIAYYSYENEAFCDSYDPWGVPDTCCGKWNDGFGWHDLYGCSCHDCGTDNWDTFSTGSNGGYVCVDRH